jgi:hypothetical protein
MPPIPSTWESSELCSTLEENLEVWRVSEVPLINSVGEPIKVRCHASPRGGGGAVTRVTILDESTLPAFVVSLLVVGSSRGSWVDVHI